MEAAMAPGDIARVALALLAEIERGSLQADARAVRFLTSVAEMLDPEPRKG